MNLFDSLETAPSDALSLCVGIDPTVQTLGLWGLDDTAKGARQFSLTMLNAALGHAKIVKFQVAYFERFGAAGYQVLSDVIQEARNMGLLVIADAKRSDIGSTIDAYSMAWIRKNAPLQVDAITVTPYLGFGSLEPLFSRASDAGAYVFVVARSSNPEGTKLQEHGSPKLWHMLLDEISEWGQVHGPQTLGAVVGATSPHDVKYALEKLPDAYFLVPGIGAQGASLRDVETVTKDKKRLITSSSRALAAVGPDVSDIRKALVRRS